MIAERPGPSATDAAELIATLGLNPRLFTSLKLISQSDDGQLVLGQFEITGPQDQVAALKWAHASVTGSTTMPLRFAPSLPAGDRPR
jgi:hypothetical protein